MDTVSKYSESVLSKFSDMHELSILKVKNPTIFSAMLNELNSFLNNIDMPCDIIDSKGEHFTIIAKNTDDQEYSNFNSQIIEYQVKKITERYLSQ